ncbi:MAG: glutamine-hydrolyzing carbamoyl-phosphate synthase small subunit [bacterium]
MKKAILMLEDGTYYEGLSAGYDGETFGEIVFNTSMTGYQEILTDPSYKGQIVTMTYTEIGNYGINVNDIESKEVQVEGFVMKEISKINSNWRSDMSLVNYLKHNKIVAIEGIDTRALTRHIRDFGAMKSVLSTEDYNLKSLLKKVKASQSINGIDLAKEVSTTKPYKWTEKLKEVGMLKYERKYVCVGKNTKKYKVVAIDCGIKHNILRILADLNCNVTVVPITATAEEILQLKPDGIFISNGPGDPSAVPYIVAEIKKLLGKKPIFGICFGHQLLGQALGGKTYKLKFGHRGANHPVMEMNTRKIDITVQNHGYAVDQKSFKKSKHKVDITHINLNDQTVEGLEVKKIKAFSIQHHPEASAGPHDARYIFNKFIKNMK